MSKLGEKVALSIDRLKFYEGLQNSESYYLAFSGGKDSCVVKRLMDMAGVKYDAHYRVTSVDPPELVQFIKEQHPDVHRDVPRYGTQRGEEWEGKPITMWNLIPWKLLPPTRIVRYCCDFLKEDGGDGRLAVTGVRWAESVNRAKKTRRCDNLWQGRQQDGGGKPVFQTDRKSRCRDGERQLRDAADAGCLRDAAQDRTEPNHRLDGSGRVGFHPS